MKSFLQYKLGDVTIVIENNEYMVIEPTFPSNLKNVFNMIMEKIYDNLPVGQQTESSHDVINRVLIEVLEELGLKNDDPSLLPKLLYYILREVEGYGKIDPLMRDPNVEEISVLGANEPVIVVHKLNTQTRWLKTNIVFERDELDRFIIKLAQKCGSSISAAFPIKELRTPEGHRIILFYGHEVTGKGSSFIIRKFPSSPISIIQLIDWDMLSSLEAAYLWLLLEHKKPIVIVGEMASGKTTLLSSLITLIPPDASIVTIEDTPELNLLHKNWLPLYTRNSMSTLSEEGKLSIGYLKLMKAALRTRADYIIPGEVRGKEAKILISQIFSLGHGGLTTMHASNASSAIRRLMAPPLNLGVNELSLISAIVTVKRVKLEGKWFRKVLSIDEVILHRNRIKLKRIFSWDDKLKAHTPLVAEEVVNKSVRIKEITPNIDELLSDLENRVRFLERLRQLKAYDNDIVTRELYSFYQLNEDMRKCSVAQALSTS